MALTKAQRARLEKLATYLEGLPEDYEHFGMRSWLDANSHDALVRYARENGGVASCGTVACAVGHGPAAGVLVPSGMIERQGLTVDWWRYSKLFSGDNSNVFQWLFEADWAGLDDSHFGAAARIRYLLDKGEPPIGFSYPRKDGRRFLALYAPYRIDAKAPANA